jgi:hypothetical protein
MSQVRHVKAADTLSIRVHEVVRVDDREPRVAHLPELLIQATVVTFGDATNEGQLVEGVAIPWFEILRELSRDANFLFNLDWRKLEELIAGAYKTEGWPDVVLTPHGGDKGRDVIASKPGIGAIRIIDQVKSYKPQPRSACERCEGTPRRVSARPEHVQRGDHSDFHLRSRGSRMK